MPTQRASNVDRWLKRETPRVRKALENASRHFDNNDHLSVNTLEAVYGRESSFGTMMRQRGSSAAAGHFHLEPKTARQYGLIVSKHNDQRFDLHRAASAAVRYLKDLDTMFSKKTTIRKTVKTIPIRDPAERKKFVLAAYNGGQGRIATAQRLAEQSGKNPQLWRDVERFLELAKATPRKASEIRHYVEAVLAYEIEFAKKSTAKKSLKRKQANKQTSWCTVGHWRTIDDRPVFICG